MPTCFPRFVAALCILLLIGGLSLTCIFGAALAVPVVLHGEHTNHAAGQIVAIGPGKDFVLETARGQHLFFQCGAQCHASLGHMQRHMREQAHTDVYYVEGPDKILLALDVD